MNREYRIEDLTKEEAAYIGEKINEIVPHEVEADEEEFVLKIENENGGIINGNLMPFPRGIDAHAPQEKGHFISAL